MLNILIYFYFQIALCMAAYPMSIGSSNCDSIISVAATGFTAQTPDSIIIGGQTNDRTLI